MSYQLGKERLWLAPRLDTKDEFSEEFTTFADTILLDAYQKDLYGGTGHTSDWPRFIQLSAAYPKTKWILAGTKIGQCIIYASRFLIRYKA